MKNLICSLLFLTVLATAPYAHALVRPQGEFVIKGAEMEKTAARFYFEKVSNIRLEQVDLGEGAVAFDLSFSEPGRDAVSNNRYLLVEKRDIGCGSFQWILKAAGMRDGGGNEMNARNSMVLTDHTHRMCEDYRAHTWQASVRVGYGFCGTMDATMTIVGNPYNYRY